MERAGWNFNPFPYRTTPSHTKLEDGRAAREGGTHTTDGGSIGWRGTGAHAFCSHNEQSINVSSVPATCMDGGIERQAGPPLEFR